MRNAEATKERILEVAMAEFSSYGIAGARVDRIAKQADCNKNLIYIYFENKETLFTTVLQKNLTRVYEEITFTPDDLPGFAARVFDWAMTHPDIIRLMEWNKLENKVDNLTARASVQDKKIKMLKTAQKTGLNGSFTPEFLLSFIMTIATAWSGINPFALSLDSDDEKMLLQTRNAIVEVVKMITQRAE